MSAQGLTLYALDIESLSLSLTLTELPRINTPKPARESPTLACVT
ncbi:hypothetical protein FOQG_06801 [Fusarium oxysporum f. sp. raphani 54005]|uniref:Uncharacterized protein n=2 Tax=Fusarium oxysporum TaxID=5507 RepID=X0C8V0_FUSOX|nr:hypothetical protein FOVG_05996 [Fusarium oxysporum f. sp. pisi HDV247]EXK90561.1 hypothetical protein FOQG_06801 [Fusarium oxysporum f. sp. raphani 54005]